MNISLLPQGAKSASHPTNTKYFQRSLLVNLNDFGVTLEDHLEAQLIKFGLRERISSGRKVIFPLRGFWEPYIAFQGLPGTLVTRA